MATRGCGCIVIVTDVCGQGDPPLGEWIPRKPPRVPRWHLVLLKASPKLGIEVVIPGDKVHLLLPSHFPQKLGGHPEAFTMGFSTRLRAGTTSIVSSQSQACRGLGLRRRCMAWRLAGGGLESGGRGSRAKRRGMARGFPHNCTGLWEAGSRQDGVPEGGERHTTAAMPPLQTGIADFSWRVDPSPKSTPPAYSLLT
ncbi:uncharacterized protein LOC108301259 [Cebus imitator]|uniref:uncharacterized protein LOC108301259 n=1 Tax=Cebus imitator TaxID=2715852 RepID=UPI000809C0D1|nr:uncharacterized protein LOC108301259 [Cebus imitator]